MKVEILGSLRNLHDDQLRDFSSSLGIVTVVQSSDTSQVIRLGGGIKNVYTLLV
jgi:hypothetical protein